MKLIVGLGNVGDQYTLTRHNAGFMVVDKMAKLGQEWRSIATLCKTEVGEHTCLLAKPLLYMNRSGGPVQSLMSFYKIPIDDLVVIHDDIDLPLGTVKVKRGGGSAGHNGIKSIDTAVGNEYFRIRIGVGKPDNNVADYVLAQFTNQELDVLSAVSVKIISNMAVLLGGDLVRYSQLL